MKLAEPTANPSAIVAEELLGVIERIERLELKKSAVAGDIRDVFAEAKGCGYDVKAIREIIKIRRVEAAVREEQEMIVEVYKRALGMATDFDEREAA